MSVTKQRTEAQRSQVTPKALWLRVVGLRSLGQQLSPALPCAQLTSLLLPCQGNNVEEPKGVTSEGSRPWPCPPSPAPASEPSPSLPLVVLEFDKFLEERAKVADRLPNLSSPSTEGPPGPPPGTALRKKTQEKDDDMLFAL